MKQESVITRKLTEAQEAHADKTRQLQQTAVLYRLYTEERSNLTTLIRRYFHGATLLIGTGLYDGLSEVCAVIEVIGTLADLQRVFDLAGDIRVANGQTSVIVTYQTVNSVNVCEPTV